MHQVSADAAMENSTHNVLPPTSQLARKPDAEILFLYRQGKQIHLENASQQRLVSYQNTQTIKISFDFDVLIINARQLAGHTIIIHSLKNTGRSLQIEGRDIANISHILKAEDSGYLEWNQDGLPEIHYQNIKQVMLNVHPQAEIHIEPPYAEAPTALGLTRYPGYLQLRSKTQQFPATLFQSGSKVTLFSPLQAEHTETVNRKP
ncbi:hypothetical protein QUF61_11765 [Candidatus Venteria ishoeyi]|uniref:hypothetical protein n=1 Tax=Candidatus Venteria ishoeyi TaxID=1899563 RepID=UPI0025A5C970|nr:hypothetical protein [Candidatus Venteria ishoeyi]MDM8547162.1 hypothetical protein [Candidatus Venteria ishoeyi]